MCWERQAISTAAAHTPGPEAAGAQGLGEMVRVFLMKDGGSSSGGRDEEGSLYGRVGRADHAWQSFNFCILFIFSFRLLLISVLLESLNKNEQSANGQSHSRESTNPQFKKTSGDFPSANGEAGGEAPKGYTQDQVDAVKRCVRSSPWLRLAV